MTRGSGEQKQEGPLLQVLTLFVRRGAMVSPPGTETEHNKCSCSGQLRLWGACHNSKFMTFRREALTFVIIVDDSVTQNACNGGKSRKPNIDMRGIFTARFRLTAGAFYPKLGKVGKDVIEGEVWCKRIPDIAFSSVLRVRPPGRFG